jgi:HEAT repeat protein
MANIISSQFGQPDIENLKAQKDIKGLIKALDYKKEASIRAGAALALGEIKDPTAVEPLMAALTDSDIEVRKQTAWALHEIGDSRVEPLITILKNAPKRLIFDSMKGEAGVYFGAIEALIQIGPPAVPSLIATLRKSNIRRVSAEILGCIKDVRAVEPLITALGDEDRYVREEAAKALAKTGSPSVEPLIAEFKNSKREVRKSSAQTLAIIRDPRAIEPLNQLLQDSDGDVREAASAALKALRLKPIYAFYHDENEFSAEVWLSKLGDYETQHKGRYRISGDVLKDETLKAREMETAFRGLARINGSAKEVSTLAEVLEVIAESLLTSSDEVQIVFAALWPEGIKKDRLISNGFFFTENLVDAQALIDKLEIIETTWQGRL